MYYRKNNRQDDIIIIIWKTIYFARKQFSTNVKIK